jgi:hypothetical protein
MVEKTKYSIADITNQTGCFVLLVLDEAGTSKQRC